MALILPIGELRPRLGRDVFVAPNATLIGDVELGDEANVWFGAVLRGDIGPIRVGPRANIQDLVCIHLTGGLSQALIGADVTVGHGTILHGCVIGNRCLIGMGSVLLDNAQIGEDSVIAAGSVVTSNMVIPPRSLVRGAPGRVIREVTADEARMGIEGAEHYVINARRLRAICEAEEAARESSPTRGKHGASEAPGRRSREGWEVERETERRERALSFGNERDVNED
jgi:carbonic anhydrase/acetyltransferase-like protein (isoleucine patch superfamily)